MPEEPPPSFYVPTAEELAPLFHGYEIQSILGYGGMGVVYKAFQRFFNREVAIKLLLSQTFGEEEFFRQFLAEAQSMAVLEHENLLKIYDYGEVNGMLFIIMEYVKGCSLHDAISVQGVEPMQTAQIMMRICEGLAHAHDAHILHRDLKPENILIDEFANPKVADFGLARDNLEQVKEKVIWGSPGYIAPEVIHAPELVGYHTDVYALGCVMYHMLTGKIPDPNETDYSLFQFLDPYFRYILDHSMCPDIAERYPTAREMGEAFRDLILSMDERGSNGVVSYDPVI